MNILFFDIENTPLVSYTWGLYDQNVVYMEKDWELLSVAYSWGEKGAIQSIDRQGQKSDLNITKDLWKLLDKADVVIAHNAKAFDVKKANAKFAEHRLGPPSPYHVVDTLTIARSKFKFTSNKLDDLARRLDVPRKLPHSGISMWLGCMAGVASDWKLMIKYNKQDITVLRDVYEILAPFAKGIPNKGDGCSCGSFNLQRRGVAHTRKHSYAQYKCNDCGKWFRDSKAIARKEQGRVAL